LFLSSLKPDFPWVIFGIGITVATGIIIAIIVGFKKDRQHKISKTERGAEQ